MKTARAFGPYEPDAYGLEMQLLSEGRLFWQELQAIRKGEKEIREIEAALKQAHQLSDTKDWIGTGRYRFRCSSTAGRRTLDRKALHGELEEIFAFEKIEGIDVDALLSRCERQGEPSSRLCVNAVPNKEN